MFDEMLEEGIAPLMGNLVLLEKIDPSPSPLEYVQPPITVVSLSSESKAIVVEEDGTKTTETIKETVVPTAMTTETFKTTDKAPEEIHLGRATVQDGL